jgi:hypothetical protein
MPHKYANDFHIDKDQVVRWNSNNHVPFNDMLMEFLQEGLISVSQCINSNCQRDIDNSAFFKRYREEQANHVPDEEEMFEMRAAFGEGATVVNVITGKKVKL